MPTTYEIWVSSPFGARIAAVPPEAIEKLTYTLSVNAVGTLTVQIARDAIPDAYVVPDAQIEVWRTPVGGSPHREADGPWLLETDTIGLDASGKRYRRLKAVTANTILNWRSVMYYANDTTYSSRSSVPADNLMKSIVTQNMGATADNSPLVGQGWPSRLWTSYLTIEADASLGPSVTKQFAWRSVMSVLQEIGRGAADGGTPVYFDVVTGTTTMLAFRTWVNVRGVDRSSGPSITVISPERGSLGDTVERTVDWSNMATAVAAGGQGQDAQRVIGLSFDAGRIGLSPFGLRELFVDATQLTSAAALAFDALGEVRAHRPKKVLTGSLISTSGAAYGLDWGFGDKLVAQFESDSFTARVESVTVTLEKDKETVTAAIRGET